MRVSRTKLAKLVAEQTLKDGLSKKQENEIAAYLLSEQRTSELDSLLRDVGEIWAERGFVDVRAVSAHPINEGVKADIKSEVKKTFPKAHKIMITSVHDPEVIGGIRLEFANRQHDLSVRSKLDKFKQLSTLGKG